MTTLHDSGGVLGRPLDGFFGLSQFYGHRYWLVCEVILNPPYHNCEEVRHLQQLENKVAGNCDNHE